jgi:hypothetical protein
MTFEFNNGKVIVHTYMNTLPTILAQKAHSVCKFGNMTGNMQSSIISIPSKEAVATPYTG